MGVGAKQLGNCASCGKSSLETSLVRQPQATPGLPGTKLKGIQQSWPNPSSSLQNPQDRWTSLPNEGLEPVPGITGPVIWCWTSLPNEGLEPVVCANLAQNGCWTDLPNEGLEPVPK